MRIFNKDIFKAVSFLFYKIKISLFHPRKHRIHQNRWLINFIHSECCENGNNKSSVGRHSFETSASSSSSSTPPAVVQNQLFPVLIRFRCNCLRYTPKGERERSRGRRILFWFPRWPPSADSSSLIRCDFNCVRRKHKNRREAVKGMLCVQSPGSIETTREISPDRDGRTAPPSIVRHYNTSENPINLLRTE